MSVSDHAYIIYHAHYQETGALVKFLTCHHGVVSAIVRGVHQPNKKSSALRAAVQLGNLVECQWSGKSSLKTVYQVDLVKAPCFDSTEKFICLAYVHELLLYFLHEDYPVDNVFACYCDFLQGLQNNAVELSLRQFEFRLLECMGYGMDLGYAIDQELQVQPGCWYQLVPDSGIRLATVVDEQCFPGEHLLAIQRGDYNGRPVMAAAKKITRKLLFHYMEGRPIKARQLYKELFN